MWNIKYCVYQSVVYPESYDAEIFKDDYIGEELKKGIENFIDIQKQRRNANIDRCGDFCGEIFYFVN